ncbi:2-C-methyl-D-erythritol 4-phosphate cytidylyltransferase [Jeotgalibacillus soli]|uniref:2-C-methyl-D-erythritol 4-phosphate cytidylyltransferase n=1 Tax=Jeotgalibacillus soli TaxID=889306 RepID=A0A0C2W6W0_9BACL|nr:2-C-methyl-D-erythritol 4-phosphate cytidylyltransferase [Jeotgalibacillus soli]KIL52316.1 2-C-methyl-D-erythritol 4-phosphate cytidylyltransferase [Jeotgalibacillus soli]
MEYQVIIPAAGQGKRMGANRNKLLLEVDGRPIIVHTLKVFEQDENCRGILLAIHPDDHLVLLELFDQYNIRKVTAMVEGGKERQQSVYYALKQALPNGVVLVHDGARPFIQQNTINELVSVAKETGAAIAAVPVKDTIKTVKQGLVDKTIERSSLWSVQTPQAFRHSLLMEAYEQAESSAFLGTDDASLVEEMGKKIQVVEADYDNIKLTTKEDLIFAEAIIRKRKEQ